MLDVARTVDMSAEEQDPMKASVTRQQHGTTMKRVQTISGVTDEAGAVFEQMLRRSHSDSSSSGGRRPNHRRVPAHQLTAIAETRHSGLYDTESTGDWNTSLTRDSVATRLSSGDGLDEVDAVPTHGSAHNDDFQPLSGDILPSHDSSGVRRLSTEALEEFNKRFSSTQPREYFPQDSRDSGDILASSGVSGYPASVSVELADDVSDADDESKRKENMPKKKKSVFQRVRERLRATFSREEDRSRAARKAEKYINANGKSSKRNRFTASFRRKSKKPQEGRGSENSSSTASTRLASSVNSSNDPQWRQVAAPSDSKKSRGVLASLQRRFSSKRVKRSQSRASGSVGTPASQSGDETNIHPLSKSQEKILSKYTPTDVVDGEVRSRPGRHSVRATLELDIRQPIRPADTAADAEKVVVYAEPALCSDLEDRVKDWDFIDGDDAPMKHATDRRFSEKSPAEKEELYERIASQLGSIGDAYSIRPPPGAGDFSECSGTQEAASGAQAMAVDLSSLARQLLNNASGSYSSFQTVVSEAVRGESGLQQIAFMFQLSMAAIEHAGVGTRIAVNIKNMTMQYFEQYFAPWVVEQGGWESVVESPDSELD